MWQIIERSNNCSTWTIISQSKDLGELNFRKEENLFIVWSPEPEDTPDQQNFAIRQVLTLNKGQILRVTIGVEISIKPSSRILTCSGDCFCVVTATSRGCETKYCAGDYCWWVSCGEAC